jgi:hypothetical protein
MARIPKMRNRRCSDCGSEFARWLGFLPLTHAAAHRLVFAWIFLLSALGVVGLTLAVVWFVELRQAGVW